MSSQIIHVNFIKKLVFPYLNEFKEKVKLGPKHKRVNSGSPLCMPTISTFHNSILFDIKVYVINSFIKKKESIRNRLSGCPRKC